MRIFLAFLLLAIASPVSRADITADSAEYADVFASYTAWTNGAGILRIPAGTAIWTNHISFAKPGLQVIGAGQDQTIIFDKNPSSLPLMRYSPSSTLIGRVSGFTIIVTNGSLSAQQIYVGAVSTTNVVRVDHITITNISMTVGNNRGVEFDGQNYSLMDHCKLYSYGTGQMVDVHGPQLGTLFTNPNGVTGIPNGSGANIGTNYWPYWDSRPLGEGTTNMVYIEDNVFSFPDVNPLTGKASTGGNGFVDSYYGAKWVARFNTGTNSNFGCHGLDSSGAPRGTVWYEVYGNNIVQNVNLLSFSFRSGSGVIFSNTVSINSATKQNVTRIDYYRSSGITIYTNDHRLYGTELGGGPYDQDPSACCYPFGPAHATNYWSGPGNTGLGMTADPYGYPAMDQMGWGPPTIYTSTNVIQTANPLYQWENTMNGAVGFPFSNGSAHENTGDYAYIPNSTNLIKSGRDYFDYTPRPAYTPLSYPHPLIAATEGGNTAPTITTMTNIIIVHDTAATNAFTIGDSETAATSLTVTATSSDETIMPQAGLTIRGTGASRTIEMVPSAGLGGFSTVTVTVSDGTNSTSSAFTLTVDAPTENTAPTLAAISNQTTPHDTTLVVPITVSDQETSIGSLVITGSAANTDLIASVAAEGGNATLVIVPGAGWSGTTQITVTVSDAGGLSASRSFWITVTPGTRSAQVKRTFF